MTSLRLPDDWLRPPAEFSLTPFWFWNDNLAESEISRQMDAFQQHGVDAFVLHPRLGLPTQLGWMSNALLGKMRYAIEEAHQRGMRVILYDEGMYPSGSSAGQVVAENPDYQCRGMVRIMLDELQPNTIVSGVAIDAQGKLTLKDNQILLVETLYKGRKYAVVERPIHSVIRGLHYIDESIRDSTGESLESSPSAADLLNPDAVACFIRLVYDRFYGEFGDYFGTTIPAIFTDEPMLLGRPQEAGVLPATRDILTHISAFLGYDFSPYLPALWDDSAPDFLHQDFERAIEHRFEQTYYQQIYTWCEQHDIALTGHPAEPDAIRHLRYFHMPGQDIVWRQIEMDRPSALEGRQSTQAKAASSMMLHNHHRRNINEFCGAYGHELTFEEMCWLAYWLLIRGCNLLIPHAFYYSVRGPRKDDRPPDVGMHSPWWETHFSAFALACRRLAWLNTDSKLICNVAIVGEHHRLPWRAAKACFQHQIDFNYLDLDDLTNCRLSDGNLCIADQSYTVLIVDGEIRTDVKARLEQFTTSVTVLWWHDAMVDNIQILKSYLPPSPFYNCNTEDLRIRHIHKSGLDWYMVFNEGMKPLRCELDLPDAYIVDLIGLEINRFDGRFSLDPHSLCVLVKVNSNENHSTVR